MCSNGCRVDYWVGGGKPEFRLRTLSLRELVQLLLLEHYTNYKVDTAETVEKVA